MSSNAKPLKDGRWLAVTGVALLAAGGLPIAVFAVLDDLNDTSGKRFAAVLAFAGVLVTACTTVVGFLIARQSDQRVSREKEAETRRLEHEKRLESARLQREKEVEDERLRLDAAMRAGQLIGAEDQGSPSKATVASGLLALAQLGQADLAVALLVDLWCPASRAVSTETAILVLDAALRSQQRNTQLIAAEILCRNADCLDPSQSLHWPDCINAEWDPTFGGKTKLLLIDALMLMTLQDRYRNENALQSVAVRLYCIWSLDNDHHVKGCLAKLIKAISDEATEERLGYAEFMQGSERVALTQLKAAGETWERNPNGLLYAIVLNREERLREWTRGAVGRRILEPGHGRIGGSCAVPPLEQPSGSTSTLVLA